MFDIHSSSITQEDGNHLNMFTLSGSKNKVISVLQDRKFGWYFESSSYTLPHSELKLCPSVYNDDSGNKVNERAFVLLHDANLTEIAVGYVESISSPFVAVDIIFHELFDGTQNISWLHDETLVEIEVAEGELNHVCENGLLEMESCYVGLYYDEFLTDQLTDGKHRLHLDL